MQLPSSFISSSKGESKARPETSKPKPRRRKAKIKAKKTKRRGGKKGKLTPGLIKGMKALLQSTNPRVSAAMKAGIRRKLKEEGVR